MDAVVSKSPVKPFSLKDAPSLIERVWPAQKISVEAQKERKAGAGQTLTALGSYWKGRKPLILVRACILASLLPATDDPEKDLEIFEILVGMSTDQIVSRFKKPLTVDEILDLGSPSEQVALLEADDDGSLRMRNLSKRAKIEKMVGIIARMPYQQRVDRLFRPEEVLEDDLTAPHFTAINKHLGTTARSLPELVEQLGIARFGHRPKLADTFCGGGSIPFEAARVGCDVYASDLNPIACMLTWGAFNIIGASKEKRVEIEKTQKKVVAAVDVEITRLGIEHDKRGNRAKAYLYCLETRCPQTGWMVPMAPSWVISKTRNVVARLVPDHPNKRYDIEIHLGVSSAEMAEAEKGTVRDGRLIHPMNAEHSGVEIKTIRGDYKDTAGNTRNRLRPWEKSDFVPQANDIWQERLYCIQWVARESLGKGRQETFFAAVNDDDLARERKVEAIVRENLSRWQDEGLVPDMPIEPGDNTTQPIRERGWTHWHHLFGARALLMSAIAVGTDPANPYVRLGWAAALDFLSRLCGWATGAKWDGGPTNTFNNQALNTQMDYGNYALNGTLNLFQKVFATWSALPQTDFRVDAMPASQSTNFAEIFLTDPPYADAVNYHEITEFFIGWLRKNPPVPFKNWIWDSRRPLAIKGDGEDFRKGMVQAYKAMADHMPDNGLQIVMFTHQDAGVWGDMAQIFWGAGLRVMAAWYIATETASELKKGGYVQGTVILVLRKRKDGEHGYKDEVVQEVKVEVAEQIDTMAGLNQTLKGHGRIENLFEDADLQMAGYAAALRVLTKYTTIDGVDMTKEALRPRVKGERGLVGEIIEFAVQVANEHMVPEGMSPKIWEQLTGSERFLFKMMDIETTGAKKLDNYQNFAKAFRVAKYDDLMGSMEPNKARLKSAKEFKKSGFEGSEFGASKSRALLFAIFELQNDIDGDDVLSHLRDLVPDYFNVRDNLAALADYVAKKRANTDESEARAAAILHGLIRSERFG